MYFFCHHKEHLHLFRLHVLFLYTEKESVEDSKPAPAIPSGVSQTLIQYSTVQYSTVQYGTDLDAAGVVPGEEEVALDVECDAVDVVAVPSQLLGGNIPLKSYGLKNKMS